MMYPFRSLLAFPLVLWLHCGSFAALLYTVDETPAGPAVGHDHQLGADLPIWNKPARFESLKRALLDGDYGYFRFPNGSLSNDYHWNGAGRMDSTGLWIPDSMRWEPGFLVETRWRGTTKDSYGSRKASHLVDGDSASWWWGALDSKVDPPWFVVDLGEVRTASSVRLLWGKLKPKSFELLAWEGETTYPGPHQMVNNGWKRVLKVSTGKGASSEKFAERAARWWAVRFRAEDLAPEGVQVAEFELRKGSEPVTRNVPNSMEQSRAYALGTRPGGLIRTDWTGLQWTFEVFMDYIKGIPDGRALICVNAATGSPAEAAAWVRYANQVQNYGIRDWQVGNELDGEWEEGGPLSAAQYAARFVAFARAMKAVDPHIRVHGPLYSTDDFTGKGDGQFQGKHWIETFLSAVAAAEKQDGKRYLDVFDFHTYPYWTAQGVDPVAMIAAPLRTVAFYDTLDAWMARYLEKPLERGIHVSEFSSTVVASDQQMRAVQGATVASQYAAFVSHYGDRGQALPWDSYGDLQKGPDGTMGSMRFVNPLPGGAWSSWGLVYPTAQFYGTWLAHREWAGKGKSPFRVAGEDPRQVRAFALGASDSLDVLLVNLSAEASTVIVARGNGKAALRTQWHFGDREYAWQGTDAQAFAMPGGAPSSQRKEAAAADTVVVAPLGMALVQWRSVLPKPGKLDLWHWQVVRQVLTGGDTLAVFGTLRQAGGVVRGGDWSVAGLGKGSLAALDGAFDGECEPFMLRVAIPASARPADYRLVLNAQGAGGVKLADSVTFRVRGAYRTVALIDAFDSDELQSAQNNQAAWYPYAHGSNGSELLLERKPGPAPLGGWLQARFHILQPATQSWPNFAGAHLPMDGDSWQGKRTAGVVFDYSTRHSSADGYFELLVPTTAVTDYDEFVIRLRDTHGQWARDTVFWSELRQEGWGVPKGNLVPATIKELEWRVRGAGEGVVQLDNVYLLAEDGAAVAMPTTLRRLR